jgi:predicted NUDIX family phosphoesterase
VGNISTRRLLDQIEEVLRDLGRPLSARALVHEISERRPGEIGGATPWKTIGARLAVDIRSNPSSPFKRVGRGLYALREWASLPEFTVRPRVIHPLDEDILVVPLAIFQTEISDPIAPGFYSLPYSQLLQHSRSVPRRVAEQTEDFVQLIPSFIVFRQTEVLSYKRTKKTPENRLHDSFTIIFGGHLQAEDVPELFSHDHEMIEDFVFRELFEELELAPPACRKTYLGVLYLQDSAFERQHAGLVFALDTEPGSAARSLEPGYHSNLAFTSWDGINQTTIINDRWSEVVIKLLAGER